MFAKSKYRLLYIFLSALSLLILEGALSPSFASQITAKYISSPITIDGVPNEPAWALSEYVTFATHPASNDSTISKAKILWDQNYLYAAFDISDTKVETANQSWNDDSITFSLNIDGRLYKNRIDLRGTGEGLANRAIAIKPGTIPDDNTNIDTGFTIEMRIPWTALGKVPQSGVIIPVDFLSVDHDNNPGAAYNATGTIFSKISYDGDKNPDTANCSLMLTIHLSAYEKINLPGGICDFYGVSNALNIGDVVRIKNTSGTIEYGSSTVKEKGKYGLLTIYGDDPITSLTEGASENEEVTFYVNGNKEPIKANWLNGETIRVDFSANSAPELLPIGDKIINAQEELKFIVSANDLEGDQLTYLIENPPEGATFDPETHAFTWIPAFNQQGIHGDIIFSVSDGNLTDFETISIKVTSPVCLINFETEDFDTLNHSVVYNSIENAWGQAFIVSSISNESSNSFNVPYSEDYAIWIRLSRESDLADSVNIKIDSDPEIVIGNETGNDNGLTWCNFKNSDPNNKIIVPLCKGKHTLSIKDTESEVKIDSVIITNDLSYIPPEVPPNISIGDWTQVVSDGFNSIDPGNGLKNHEAKLMEYNGSLYASTSNAGLHPAIFKTDDGVTFQKAYELKTPYGHGYYMYRTLDLKYLDLGLNSGLYVVSDDWYGGAYLSKINEEGGYQIIRMGSYITYMQGSGQYATPTLYFNVRGWWFKDIVAYKNKAYAGFYNDWNLWFTMRSAENPIIGPNDPEHSGERNNWFDVSLPAFGKDAQGKDHANMDTDSSCVFKGYLYVGTYNNGYFGRTTSGAQIWRTNDGTNWQCVVPNGFGSTSRSSISQMVVFGGYLYATTAIPFGSNYIYRTKDGVTWELAFQGMGNEPYFGDITAYMGRLYLTTYNWGGRVYSSLDGKIWTPVSSPYINNNSQNSLVGDLQPFKGYMYVNTRNGVAGTNIFRAKVK